MRDNNRHGQYDYNMDVARAMAHRGGGGGGSSLAHGLSSSMGQYPQDITLMGTSGIPTSYRSGSYPPGVGSKSYYPMGTDWTDTYATDGGVDYELGCSPYPVINNDPVHMGVSYNHWASANKQKSAGHNNNNHNNVYMDPEAGYAYNTAPTAGLVHRPAVSVPADTSAYSFTSLASSLPAATNERLLPTPVSRTLGSSGSNYRIDALPSVYGKPGHGSSIPGGPPVQTPSPVSPDSDVTTVGYASSAYEYATPGRSSQHHGGGGGNSADAYAPLSSGTGETIFGDSDRNAGTQGPAVDLGGYTYGGTSPVDTASLRRASSGSGLTSRSVAGSSASSGAGYVGSDGGASTAHGSGAYHHSSSTSSHGHQYNHHHHGHHAGLHHASPRHGSHHLSQQQQQHAVTGGTAYGEASTGGGSAVGGVGGTTASLSDRHRTSVTSRR